MDHLIKTLPERPPTLFVRIATADFIAELDQIYSVSHPGTWQISATEKQRDMRIGGRVVSYRNVPVINWFGFRHVGYNRHGSSNGKQSSYHKILDPVTFYNRRGSSNIDGAATLLRWGVNIRDWCASSGVEVRSTQGSIGAQFLVDPRFYPDARRKVPMATNDRMRDHLPGNYYHLRVEPNPRVSYNVWHIDQRRSHHYHAATVTLPHADDLYAHGYFRNLGAYISSDIRSSFSGLYNLDVQVPGHRIGTFVQWWLRCKRGAVLERKYIYSNELPALTAMGFEVIGVRGAWGSYKHDTGLPKYAEWANQQLDEYENAKWLKSILISTYGVLATRSRIPQMLFKRAANGEPVEMHTGRNVLQMQRLSFHHKVEPRHVNVLQRGMIEAATRLESILYSQYLTSKGYRVIHVYADGLYVEVDEDKGPPPTIDPWRLKETLTHYQPINPIAFTSDQGSKLPGVGREMLKYTQQSPGVAPRTARMFEAGTGRPVYVNMVTNKIV